MTGKPRGRYSPVDPVACGAPVRCPNGTTGVLSAIAGDNSDLIAEVAKLWIAPNDRVVDVTFGKGVFWNRLPSQKVEGSDLNSGVDCRALPYGDRSVDVLVFDPPYQPMHGKPTRSFGVGDSYNLAKTALQTINDVLTLYQEGLTEAARVVRAEGRVLVKCQDLTYNHRLHLVHLDVIRHMANSGFDLADMFVLFNKSRMPQRTTRQERAHRAHSYLLVGSRMRPHTKAIQTDERDLGGGE